MSARDSSPAPAGIGPTGWAPVVALSVFLMVLGGLAYLHPGMFGAGAEPTIAGAGPAMPRKCCGKKTRLTPTKVPQKCTLPAVSGNARPVKRGNQ